VRTHGTLAVPDKLDELGSWYLVHGETKEAERLFRLSRRIQERRYGGDHPLGAEALYNQGALFLKKAQPGQAIACLKAALRTLRRGNCWITREILARSLGHALLQAGTFRRAELCFRWLARSPEHAGDPFVLEALGSAIRGQGAGRAAEADAVAARAEELKETLGIHR